MKEPLADSRRYTAKSVLKLTPKKEHHNTTFLCQAQNTADRTYRSAKLKLEVMFDVQFSIVFLQIYLVVTCQLLDCDVAKYANVSIF